MDTIETILGRRSVRAFRPQPIPDQDLKTILECGRWAPSAANRQPLRFVVITETDLKQEVARACANQMWMADAGAIIAIVGQPEVSPNWYLVDAGIALQNMVLAARALGYGTCWIGAFDQERLLSVFKLSIMDRVVALSPFGVPVEWPKERQRKDPREVFIFDPR